MASGNYYELNIIDSESKKSVITKTLVPIDDGSTVATLATNKGTTMLVYGSEYAKGVA